MADILDGKARAREVYAGKAIDLQINKSGRSDHVTRDGPGEELEESMLGEGAQDIQG